MLTLDGVPLRCIKCGSTDLATVGRELTTDSRPDGYPAMEFVECGCKYAAYLHTLIHKQDQAPKPKARPKARKTDPEPSQQASRLDFGGQTQSTGDIE